MIKRKTARRAVRASRLNTEIKSGVPPLIVPSVTASIADLLATPQVACSCGDCGFGFTSVASMNGQSIAPICANCGSGNVKQKAVQSASTLDDASLAAVQCPQCATYQLQHEKLAASLANGYHCILCGAEQVLKMDDAQAAVGGPAEPAPDFTTEDTAPAVDAVTPADSTTDTPATQPVADGTPPDSGAAAAPATAADETPLETPVEPAAPAAEPEVSGDEDEDDIFGVGTDDDSFPTGDDGLPEDELDVTGLDDLPEEDAECREDGVCTDDDAGDDVDTVEFSDTTELETEDVDGDDIQFELLPTDEDTELSFVYVGDKLKAFANDLHVATLRKEHAGANADLFNSEVLVRSVVAQCRETGLRKGLVAAGFKIVQVRLPVKAFVNKRVQAALGEIKRQQAASVKATANDWQQAIAVALSGLNKGFFTGRDNPLKAGLISELSALAVRNPAKIVDRAFAAHGSKFNQEILALATELHGKPIEIRNQLAETLDSTNYVPSEEPDEDAEDTDGDQSVTARLNGSGLRIEPSKPQQKNVATASTARPAAGAGTTVSRVVATHGSLFRNTRH